MSSRTLPSRVAPRSRPAARSQDEDYRPSARAPPPSGPRLPASQTSRTPNRSQPPPPPRGRMGEARTVSSTSSSSGSSFLDRMKIRGGETSSRTSLEDDYEQPSKPSGGWAPARNRRPTPAEEEFDEEDGYQDSDPAKQPAGHGYDLWGRVTAVAGNLSVNVSKAWEKGIGTVDGEETPPGQESRLTKAMKAYHLDRARSPADLPAWLFDEHERGAAPKPWNASRRGDEYEDEFIPEPEPRQRSGLREIYDQAAASAPSAPAPRRAPEGAGTSGAANRLKAIREAKRTANTRTGANVSAMDDQRRDLRANEERSSAPQPQGVRSAAPVRVGLPSGPGRARRT